MEPLAASTCSHFAYRFLFPEPNMVFSSRTGLTLAVLALAACHRQPAQQGRFSPSAPVIDGQATDWADTPLQYDDKSRLHYALLNDARTVYLRLRTADQGTQRRLLFQGVTVWLDTTGRHQQQFGVHYPLGGSVGNTLRQQVEGGAVSAEPADYRARMAQAVAGLHEMQLLKLKGSTEPTMAETHTQLGIHVATGFDADGNLIYELSVPLRLLYKRGSSSYAPDKHPTVGVTLVGGQRQPGTSGNYGGRRGGGGMRPGGPGSKPGGGSTSNQPLSLKFSTELASK